MGVVYKITNTINGKIYVGKTVSTVGRRWTQHKDYAKHKPEIDTYLYRAMRKHGIENFLVEIIDSALLDEELCAKEIEWIAKLDSMNRLIGYNGTTGGQSGLMSPAVREKIKGRACSPETREKIAAAQRGKKKSPEQYAKILEAARIRKGKPVSLERAAAMKANPPGLGTKRTPEQRKRMSDGMNAAWTPELRALQSVRQLASRAIRPRPGHKPTPENVQKMQEAVRLKRESMTAEERTILSAKLAVAQKGRKWSPEIVRKRTEAIRAAWTPEKRATFASRAREDNFLARINGSKSKEAA